MTFRCYFCNLSAKRGEVTDKESIRCQSAAQVDNTEHCYHARLGKVKSPNSQLYNFACASATERDVGELLGPRITRMTPTGPIKRFSYARFASFAAQHLN